MKTIIFAVMMIYLIAQSLMDIKHMKVYIAPNNYILGGQIILYIIDLFIHRTYFDFELVFVVLALYLITIARIYGKGDTKAMASIYLALRYVSPSYPHPDLALFFLFVFIANVLFIIFKKLYMWISKSKDKRGAFFPYLTISYFITCILGGLAYGW